MSGRRAGRFSGTVVVVTGGASGIGESVARAFLAEGAKVAVLDLQPPSDAEQPDHLVWDRCDVSDERSVESSFDRVKARWSQIDVVVHSAAVLGGSGPFHTLTLEQWRRYIDVNLTGSFLVARAAATRMIADAVSGRIILVGSVNSFAAERDAAPYVASKGGVRLLTRAAAVDLARYGITVNMIAPGPILTSATRQGFATEAMQKTLERALPAGHAGTPEDVAPTALFLAAPESRFITGTDVVVDGGMFAQILG